jgi:hypothetical protein
MSGVSSIYAAIAGLQHTFRIMDGYRTPHGVLGPTVDFFALVVDAPGSLTAPPRGVRR